MTFLTSSDQDQRHGGEGPTTIAGEPSDILDPEDPQTYPAGKKWGVTMIGAVSVLAVTMASSMMSAAIFEIRLDFPGRAQEMYILGEIFILPFNTKTRQARARLSGPDGAWRPSSSRLSFLRDRQICVELISVTSIFVLGFVVGPLLWAPLGEVMGRR